MLEYRYDTQLLIDGKDLDEDVVYDYFVDHFKGDCLLAVGDEELIKIHYHTNEPWKVLEYCASLGEIYDIVPGTFFICGLTSDSFGSLPDALAEKFKELFRYPEMYMRTMDEHVICFRVGSDEPPIRIV